MKGTCITLKLNTLGVAHKIIEEKVKKVISVLMLPLAEDTTLLSWQNWSGKRAA